MSKIINLITAALTLKLSIFKKGLKQNIYDLAVLLNLFNIFDNLRLVRDLVEKPQVSL